MVLFCLFYWSEKGTILEKTGTIWHLGPLQEAGVGQGQHSDFPGGHGVKIEILEFELLTCSY